MTPTPAPDPASDKAAVRAIVRKALAAMTPQQKIAESTDICGKLLKHDLYTRAHVVMVFAPLSDEPLIEPIVQHALAKGKTVLLPRVNWHDSTMVGALVQAWPGDLTKDHRGLTVPREDAPTYDPASMHLVLVPGLAFSSTGVRLGRGAGFYDRFLAQIPIHRRIGVCYRCQRVERIPLQPHDEPVAEVVSP
jgi:5-formyltetrahydrofolate cyclo-ligase